MEKYILPDTISPGSQVQAPCIHGLTLRFRHTNCETEKNNQSLVSLFRVTSSQPKPWKHKKHQKTHPSFSKIVGPSWPISNDMMSLKTLWRFSWHLQKASKLLVALIQRRAIYWTDERISASQQNAWMPELNQEVLGKMGTQIICERGIYRNLLHLKCSRILEIYK